MSILLATVMLSFRSAACRRLSSIKSFTIDTPAMTTIGPKAMGWPLVVDIVGII